MKTPVCERLQASYLSLAIAAMLIQPLLAERQIWLDELDLTYMASAGEPAQARLTVNGNTLKVARERFMRGVGTHAASWYALEVRGEALAFEASVGIDDEELTRGRGSAQFRVYADGAVVADSGVMRAREPVRKLKAELKGVSTVVLEVSDAGDGNRHDHADWCEAFFTVTGDTRLVPLPQAPTPQMGLLTPPSPLKPRINGARVFGVRPGNPLLFTVPVSGERPLKFSARNLPRGALLDPATGRIAGAVTRPGSYRIAITAANRHGKATRELRLEVGEGISLTPPMGWNSWNCFASKVTDASIRDAAAAMVASGLADHGWQYINIDDYWQTCPGEREDATLMGPARDAAGRILPNKRFPDMPALCDYVHGLGLKIGLYSSPGSLTCGGCIGSWEHEEQDAQTYAQWGFDYLKYDWCSYAQVAADDSLKELMHPYLKMGRALRDQGRDIVFSLCQYGMGHVSAWGGAVGGNCWRTTPDIVDTWASVQAIVAAQEGLELFAGPGNWNDPDMLVVGRVGWGNPHPTQLTPNQQYSHISLWCLLSAPLLLGCDLTALDPFTLGLLTNDEVLEVNQDELGRQANLVQRDATQEIWYKRMSDGSHILGLFNRSCMSQEVRLQPLETLSLLTDEMHARDLWRQLELGRLDSTYSATIPGHGVQLLRLRHGN